MKTIENCAALTIAGSDPGGGAGIQADLKTFSAFGVYGTSVITAVTAQNRNGVTAIQPVEPGVVQKQLEAVLETYPIKAVKTGMLFSSEIIETIAAVLSTHSPIPLVIDPVFTATSGRKLLQDDAVESLKEKLFPLATLITPNIPEAEILTGEPLRNTREMERAVSRLYRKYHVPVLLKGGHLPDRAVDIFFAGKEMER
ncbi:MAG: bifunctional hydroxymethylpyrimidine kinase/phosphomethylpyrimidine kinase, partial [bacterium]|nr:bifunctional hydroxymethylpyrimidine kinase/phosphomethylpyrimidine kinase [bacterium]